MSQLLCFFSLLSFFSIFIRSNGKYSACYESEWHGVQIKYPFWKQDGSTSEQYCGYPGFGLNCTDSEQDPIITLPNDSYYVSNINYDDNTLNLIDIDVVDIACPRVRHNFSVETLPLNQSPSDLNLTFYFNCSAPPPLSATPTPIPCLASNSNSKQSYVVEVTSKGDPFDNWYKFCEDKVVVAVKSDQVIKDVNGLITSQFNSTLPEGFLLDWNNLRECAKCEAFDGRCGYNNTAKQFVCFCDDGSTKGSNQSCKGKNNHLGLKIGLAVAASVSALLLLLVTIIYCRRKRVKHGSSVVSRNVSSYSFSMSDSEKGGGNNMGVPIFSYSELEKATNNFDPNNELGDGGFGAVYKGKLQDGREVAVKRLYENSFKRVEQFMNEIAILEPLRHPNLVVLYGSSSPECRRLLLVYEYIPNGTIADHLYGEEAKPGSLAWKTRMSIAVETASALSYLHAKEVIHRDVKTTNILLDNNFRVKVADFGLSRLFPMNVTHVSTAPQGTPGYVDPEYHQCYQLTSKSDVYSFGVVLIELISSLPAVDITRHRHEINLSNLAINKIQGNALHELVDPTLGYHSDFEVKSMITEVAELAFVCLQNEREQRPSMMEVHQVLTEIQNKYYGVKSEPEVDLLDDAFLLKNHPQNLSPKSVTTKWVSSKSTNSSSST